MGTPGLGSLGNQFLGSVATKVVRLAQVPVTLVK
jgi:nucleotide-binding universal stress UspA family protein